MKHKFKLFLRWLGMFVLCFITIYLIVFFGGWKLFESGDPILIEIGAALILSVFLFAIQETYQIQADKIKKLEQRIDELEKSKSDSI